DGEDRAGHRALARKADPEGEVAAIVVMAAGQHQSVDPARARLGGDGVAADRVGSVEGEVERGPGELAAAHRDRAMAVVEGKDVLDRVLEVAEGGDEVGEAPVEGAGLRFRHGEPLVDSDRLVAGAVAKELDEGVLRLLAR